jgi:hypothetical protein
MFVDSRRVPVLVLQRVFRIEIYAGANRRESAGEFGLRRGERVSPRFERIREHVGLFMAVNALFVGEQRADVCSHDEERVKSHQKSRMNIDVFFSLSVSFYIKHESTKTTFN